MSEPSDNDHKSHGHGASDERNPGDALFGWTSSPKAGLYVFLGLAVLCIVLFFADFAIHRHEHFPLAQFPAFHAIFGFCAFSFVVIMGWPLRKLLWRPENYYEPEDQTHD